MSEVRLCPVTHTVAGEPVQDPSSDSQAASLMPSTTSADVSPATSIKTTTDDGETDEVSTIRSIIRQNLEDYLERRSVTMQPTYTPEGYLDSLRSLARLPELDLEPQSEGIDETAAYSWWKLEFRFDQRESYPDGHLGPEAQYDDSVGVRKFKVRLRWQNASKGEKSPTTGYMIHDRKAVSGTDWEVGTAVVWVEDKYQPHPVDMLVSVHALHIPGEESASSGYYD